MLQQSSVSSGCAVLAEVARVRVAPAHGTHYCNNEISFPPPNPQYPKRTPHTSCIAAV